MDANPQVIQVLRPALDKAIKNGWYDEFPSFERGKHCTKKAKSYVISGFRLTIAFSGGYGRVLPFMDMIIFDHSFAKAFWGEEPKESTLWHIFNPPIEGIPVTYVGTYVLKWKEEDQPTVAFAPAELPAWQHHLQQMVREKNPVQYLKQFIS